jgi:D-amino-acid oxidase
VPAPAPRARVIGAGVIGLTTAMALRADGWDVDVITAEAPADTTSSVAAAFWYPYLVGPADAVERWGLTSAEQLATMARVDGLPVQARTVHELFRTADVDPGWRTQMQDDQRITGPLPDGVLDGWRYTSWVADMPLYLGWLTEQCALEDVPIEVRRIESLSAAYAPGIDLLVNCAGVGSQQLADDATVVPVAGQVIIVRAPEVTDIWLDADTPGGSTYVVPRTDTVVLGGTAGRGVWDRTPDPAATDEILARCTELVPSLAGAEVLDVQVGLRPARPEVRLELDGIAECLVLHHYGHGGAGLTLSWGSALEAVQMARNVKM